MRAKRKGKQQFICTLGKSGVYWADRMTALECFMDLQGLDRHQSCRVSEQAATADVFTVVPV